MSLEGVVIEHVDPFYIVYKDGIKQRSFDDRSSRYAYENAEMYAEGLRKRESKRLGK